MSAEGISSQVRRIAILVTSLDASAGRQLLMAMPTELARQVRRAMTQLGSIDPEEQRQILAEFRMQAMTQQPSTAKPQSANPGSVPKPQGASPGFVSKPQGASIGSPHGVDPSYESHNAHQNSTRQAHAEFNRDAEPGLAPYGSGREPGLAPYGSGREPGLAPYGLDRQSASGRHQSSNGSWQQLDVKTLSELLRGERATVVAVVLSQLDAQAGAQLLGSLPKPLQREVILSLSRLGQIDPDAMAAIDEHLAGRIIDYHHQRAGENESTGRIQELLAAADPELRSDWQNTLVKAEPHLASRLGIAVPAATPMQEPQRRAGPARPSAPAPANMLDLLADNVVTTADLRVAKTLSSAPASSTPAALSTSAAATPSTASTSGSTTQQSSSADARNIDSDEESNDRARILPFPPRSVITDQERSMRFDQILDMPAEDIGHVLAAADTEVILYALAGASPAFMKRFMSMLDRADGRALQNRLKQLTAINLQDVDAAQRKLCELALERQRSTQSLTRMAA